MVEKLERMAQFLLLLYTCAWFCAPVAADAPSNDLRLFQDLVRYRSVDSETADAALGVMRRHMWYLRPLIVVFSLCSESVSSDEKAAMCSTLLETPRLSGRWIEEDVAVMCIDESTRLTDFIDDASWLVFALIGPSTHAWLKQSPQQWEEDGDYRKFETFVREVKVTNDMAERGIGMLKEFAGMVREESQFQWLLQAVESHRAILPQLSKAAMNV